MILADAVASGKPWKLPEWLAWVSPTPDPTGKMRFYDEAALLASEAFRTDFIVKEEPREWTVCEQALTTNCNGAGLHYMVQATLPVIHKQIHVREVLP